MGVFGKGVELGAESLLDFDADLKGGEIASRRSRQPGRGLVQVIEIQGARVAFDGPSGRAKPKPFSDFVAHEVPVARPVVQVQPGADLRVQPPPAPVIKMMRVRQRHFVQLEDQTAAGNGKPPFIQGQTRIIFTEGIAIGQFDSADKTLDDELALDDALDNTLLLFAGTETLSGFDVTLVGAGHYRLSVVRARYDTKRQAHPVGEEVFVIRRVDLPHFLASRSPVNYKLQPFILQHELDLASATAIPVTLQYRVRRPLAPINLRVNGDGRTPTYATGAGVSVNWDRTDPRRTVQGPTAVLVPAIDRTVVQLLTVGGVLKETFTFAPTGVPESAGPVAAAAGRSGSSVVV